MEITTGTTTAVPQPEKPPLGWVCPVCRRGVNPWVTNCDCARETKPWRGTGDDWTQVTWSYT